LREGNHIDSLAKLLGLADGTRADAIPVPERSIPPHAEADDVATLNKLIPGIEANGFPCCFVGHDERYWFANKAYCMFVAKPADAIIGHAIQDVLHDEESATIAPYFDRSLRKGEIVHFHRLSVEANGHKRWVLVNYFPQSRADGSIYGLLAVVTSAERVKALETETLERERLLRVLTNNAGIPILQIDLDHVIRFGNQPLLDWLGRPATDIFGKRFTEVFPPSMVDFYMPLVQRALAGESFKVETLSLARAGEQRRIELSFYPDRRADGSVSGCILMFRDIEDDFRLRQSLIEKELKLRAIADNIGMPVSKSDLNLRYQYVNRVTAEWLDMKAEDIIGKHWSEVVGLGALEKVKAFADRALAGEIVTFEGFASFPGYKPGHIRLSMFPSKSHSGEIDGIYAVLADVENDYRLRQELVKRERQLRLITDNIAMPVSYIDTDRRVRFYNKVGFEWLGLSEQDVIGKTVSEVAGEAAANVVEPWFAKAFAGERQTYERQTTRLSGETRWVRGHLVPDIRDDGKVAGVFSVVTDINDDVKLRQELQDQQRQIRVFADNIPESISYLNHDRRYTFVNNTFLRLSGKAREEIIGEPIDAVLGAEEALLASPHIERAFKGDTVVYERSWLTMVHPKGRWYRTRVVPDFGDDGVVQGIYAVGIDIDDIKTAEVALRASEGELRAAMDSLPYPMAYVDRELKYQFVNKTMESLVGKSHAEMIDKPMDQLYSKHRLSEIETVWDRVFAGETINMERLITANNDQQRWMSVRYTPRRNADGTVVGFYSASTDIDELKRTEIELRRANWMLSSHFENTPLAVIEWDHEFRVRRWSPQAERMFGWTEAEVMGKKLNEWNFIADEDSAQVALVVEQLKAGDTPHTTSLNRNYRKDGRVIWCEWYNSNLYDESNQLMSVLSLAQDVTARVNAEERLVHQATHDSLTGLPNRVMLQERLRQSIMRARRNSSRVAALFIDLDRFKDVNDSLGHRVGDELLRLMAIRLGRVLRETDFLVRLSGDEFMVVLEQITEIESAQLVAIKLIDELRAPSMIEGHEIYISGSVGISLFPDDADDGETLLRNADMAMYRAKERGKNTFQLFSRELAEHGSNMRILENSMRTAIQRNEFELYYQPKIDMVSGRITGAEALLRWHHPSRGLVMPGEFIHLAEESGLVHDIGNWVLATAFAQLRKWRETGLDHLHVAVNIAAGQFRASNLAECIIERIKLEGCDPRMIEIEITETGMLRDPEGVGRTVSALRAVGVSVAIDDFGTGYSSLSHLKRFPIDTLKIDRSFVADVLTDRDDAAIVYAVIALAHALEINVVAEGVETEAQRTLLAQQGCGAYQGYLFSRPLSAADFDALVRKHQSSVI
jgi:diguanylate cyclase (GGDEF)-like protein/PAS domain S-box-containing protein